MGVLERRTLLAALGIAAMTATVSALPLTSSSSSAEHPGTAAVAGLTAPCTPNSGGAHGVLPQPPVVDTFKLPHHAFTLNVGSYDQGKGGTTIFCYTLAGGSAQYVEAPTIRVKAGGSFTMTLVDEIPPAIGAPTPPAHAAPNAPDGCAQLPYEDAMPPPNRPGYAGHKRIFAPMPAMAENDTNFHTHGWHVDPNVDNVFKALVYAKNGSCTYAFKVPLTQPPGSYWYHAHLHGIAQNQVGGGLGGALIVLPPDGSAPDYPDTVLLVKNDNAPPANASMAAMAGMREPLASVRENQHYGALTGGAQPAQAPRATASFDPYDPPPEPSGWAFPTPPATPAPYCPPGPSVGDPLVVNGLPVPSSMTSAAIPHVMQLVNAPRRYRLLNASADTFLNVVMLDGNGKREMLNVLARDGVPVNWHDPDPKTPLYVTRANVMIPPSGRVDLLVFGKSTTQTIAGEPGTPATAPPGGTPFCAGYIGFFMPPRGIVTIRPFSGPALGAAAVAPVAKLATRTPGDVFASSATPVTGRHALTFTQYNGASPKDMAWYVTETSKAGWVEQPFWLQTPPPGVASNYLPTIRVKQNSIEEWTLINASPEIHAFHIHQLTFVALQSAFEPTSSRTFLDTISLPAAQLVPGQGQVPYPRLVPSKTVVKIDFRNVDKGLFVYHCHMLFHEDHGMMGIVEVY